MVEIMTRWREWKSGNMVPVMVENWGTSYAEARFSLE